MHLAASREPLTSSLQAADIKWLEKCRIHVLREDGEPGIPEGAKLVQLIGEAVPSFPWLFRGADADIKRLQLLCQAASYERLPTRTSGRALGMGGLTRIAYEHTALVGGSDATKSQQLWMRAVLLRWCVGRVYETRQLDDDDIRRRWSAFLRSDSADSSSHELNPWISELGRILHLSQLGVTLPQIPSCNSNKGRDLQANIRALFPDLLQVAHNFGNHRFRQIDQGRGEDDTTELQDDLPADSCNVEIDPTPEDEEEAVSDGVNIRRVVRAEEERTAVETHLLRSTGPFVEDDNCLSPQEARYAVQRLLEAFDSPSATAAIKLDVLSVLISAATGRHWRTGRNWILNVLYLLANSAEGALQHGTPTTWRADMPRSVRIWQPRTRKDQEWIVAAAQSIVLPWPDQIHSRLEKLRMHAAELLQSSLDTKIHSSIDDSIRQGLPRFTHSRLRRTLAMGLSAAGGGPIHSQWIFGDTLGRSSAPFHYYCTNQSSIQDIYQRGLGHIYGELLEVSGTLEQTNVRIGCFAGSINDQMFRKAVESLSSRLEVTFATGTLVDQFNAAMAYAAMLLIQATGHRQTERFADITRQHLDESLGLCVFGDKVADLSQAARFGAICSIVFEQIEIALSLASKLLNDLPNSRDWANCRLSLVATLDGTGSLFIWIDPKRNRRTYPIDRNWLATQWPEFELPLPLLRARCASKLLDAGLSIEYVYRQLGHVYETQAFGIEDPVPVTDWAAAVQNCQSEFLNRDGWRVVRPRGRLKKAEPVNALTAQQILDADKSFWDREKQRATARRMNHHERTEFRERVNRALDNALSMVIPGYSAENVPQHVELSPAALQALKIAAAGSAISLDQDREARLRLIARLNRYRRLFHWTFRPIARLFQYVPPRSRITPQTLPAFRWVKEARRRLTDHGHEDQTKWFDWMAISLVLDGGVCDARVLPQAIAGLLTTTPHPNSETQSVLVDLIDTSTSSDPESFENQIRPAIASITLTGLSAILAIQAKQRIIRNPEQAQRLTKTFDQVIQARLQPLIGNVEAPLEAICKLGSLALRTQISGLLTGVRDGAIGGADLPIRHMYRQYRGDRSLYEERRERTRTFREFKSSEMESLRKRLSEALRQNLNRLPAAIDSLKALSNDSVSKPWLSMCCRWLISVLEKDREVATAYQYFTATISPAMRRLTADMDVGGDMLRHVAELNLDRMTGSTHLSYLRTTARLFRFARSEGFDIPDLEIDTDTDFPDGLVTPYILGDWEHIAISDCILQWSERQPQDTAADLRTLVGQRTVMHFSGGRTSEVEGLAASDHFFINSKHYVYIRRNSLRRIKTRGSRRLICLDDLQREGSPSDLLNCSLSEMTRRVRLASHGSPHKLSLLGQSHARIASESLSSADIYAVAAEVAVNNPQYRPYGSRHATASFLILQALCPHSPFIRSPAFELRRAPGFLGSPILRRLSQGSRIMGHTRVRTTIRHYSHFMGEFWTAQQSSIRLATSVQEAALALGHTPGALRNRWSKSSVPASAGLAHELSYFLSRFRSTLAVPTDMADSKSTAPPTFVLSRDAPVSATLRLMLDYQFLGLQYLLDSMHGESDRVQRWLQEYFITTSGDNIFRTAEDVQRDFDELHGASSSPSPQRTRRPPKPHEAPALQLAASFDRFIADDYDSSASVIRVLLRLRKSGQSRIPILSGELPAMQSVLARLGLSDRFALSDRELIPLANTQRNKAFRLFVASVELAFSEGLNPAHCQTRTVRKTTLP